MLSPDQILQDRYRIQTVLGQGGMGAVYRAFDNRVQIDCVVKEMLIPVNDTSQIAPLAQQFRREAMALASLRHPNLPRVTDYFLEHDSYYLVMDLIRGQSLEKLIGTTALAETIVLDYSDQLLSVLEYIHGLGILHRDIKPANIIVQPDGRVVLVDFGLVKDVNSTKFSRSIFRGLTPQYAPPEQYGVGTDQRSDLYSLAATMYQMLSAQAPVGAADRVAGIPLPPLRQYRNTISANTERVIMKALNLDRKLRFQNATEMRHALKGIARIVTLGPPIQKNSRALYIVSALAGVLLLILVSVLAILALNSNATALPLSTVTPTVQSQSTTSTPIRVTSVDVATRSSTIAGQEASATVLITKEASVTPSDTPIPATSTLTPSDTPIPPTPSNTPQVDQTAIAQAQATNVANATAKAQTLAAQTAQAANTVSTATVDARKGWQDTGVMINKGVSVDIEVISGQWTSQKGTTYNTGGGGYYVCANRMPASQCVEPLPTVPQDSLIGLVGNHIFAVGHKMSVVADTSGELMLRMNDADNGLFDNDGVLTVRITITK